MTDPIDQLVDWQLEQRPKHSGGVVLTPDDKCPNCRLNWHGLPTIGCAGAYQEAE